LASQSWGFALLVTFNTVSDGLLHHFQNIAHSWPIIHVNPRSCHLERRNATKSTIPPDGLKTTISTTGVQPNPNRRIDHRLSCKSIFLGSILVPDGYTISYPAASKSVC
jgi:hypothetical protein